MQKTKKLLVLRLSSGFSVIAVYFLSVCASFFLSSFLPRLVLVLSSIEIAIVIAMAQCKKKSFIHICNSFPIYIINLSMRIKQIEGKYNNNVPTTFSTKYATNNFVQNTDTHTHIYE